jgi:hypothetical protein
MPFRRRYNSSDADDDEADLSTHSRGRRYSFDSDDESKFTSRRRSPSSSGMGRQRLGSRRAGESSSSSTNGRSSFFSRLNRALSGPSPYEYEHSASRGRMNGPLNEPSPYEYSTSSRTEGRRRESSLGTHSRSSRHSGGYQPRASSRAHSGMYEAPAHGESSYSRYRPSTLQDEDERDRNRASAMDGLEGRTSRRDPSTYEFIRWGVECGLDPMQPGFAAWRNHRTRPQARRITNQVHRDLAREGYRGRPYDSDSG